MAIEILIRKGTDTGRRLVFEGFEDLVLGRATPPHPDTPAISDPYLSRHHCRLVIGAAGARVEDLDSQNGVFVNGARRPRAELSNGDMLRIGHTILEVRDVPRKSTPPLVEAAPPTNEALVLGRYERLGLARAGTPEIHHGRDKNDYRPVTLQSLPLRAADPKSALDRALAALRRYLRIEHPHLVRIRDVGVTGGRLWIVTELTLSETLEEAVRRDGSFSPEWTALIGRQLLEALHAIHYADLVHGRISPVTVLMDEREGRPLTRMAECGLEEALHIPGSEALLAADDLPAPLLPAPEQVLDARGRGPAADIYSVGVVLYRALTGASPIEPEPNAHPRARVLSEKPIPVRTRRPETPDPLAALIDQALSFAPADRFSSAEEMHRALLRTGI